MHRLRNGYGARSINSERDMMTEAEDLRNYSSRFAVCLGISVLGLLAVPYVGTRWGDFNEMVALIIGLAPLFYVLAFSITNLNRRLAALEKRK
jgi:hypothetical protein